MSRTDATPAARTSPPGTSSRIHGTDPRYHLVVDFLYDEAALLDERHHHDWLALLSEDIRYLVPVRLTTGHTLTTSTSKMAHMDEDMFSLRKRVQRFDTDHAWAEDPPSRTRRYVTNVRGWEGEEPDTIIARSNLLLFRSRGDVHDHDLLSCRREDTLRCEDDTFRISRREVWLDEAVVRMQNFAVFL